MRRPVIDPFYYEYAKRQRGALALASFVALLATSLYFDIFTKELSLGWTITYRATFLGMALFAPNFAGINKDVLRVLRALPVSPQKIAKTFWTMSCIGYPTILSGIAIVYAYFLDAPSSGWILAGVIWTLCAITTAVNTEILRGRGCFIAVAIVGALLFQVPTHPQDVGIIQIGIFLLALASLPVSFRRCEKLLPDFLASSEPLFDDELIATPESRSVVLTVKAKEAVRDAFLNIVLCAIVVAYLSNHGVFSIDEGIPVSPFVVLLASISLFGVVAAVQDIKFDLESGVYRVHRILPISSFRLAQIVLMHALVYLGIVAVVGVVMTVYLNSTRVFFIAWIIGTTGTMLIAAACTLGFAFGANKPLRLIMATVPLAFAVAEVVLVWLRQYAVASAFGLVLAALGTVSVYHLISRGTVPYRTYGITQ
ncbi:MAG: hypothetical protein SGI88_00890 [Candidatus Hydrogenedentes bacterium]|nr:hypothetical protein [Candidatus Hydrogenedentota bacterium]